MRWKTAVNCFEVRSKAHRAEKAWQESGGEADRNVCLVV